MTMERDSDAEADEAETEDEAHPEGLENVMEPPLSHMHVVSADTSAAPPPPPPQPAPPPATASASASASGRLPEEAPTAAALVFELFLEDLISEDKIVFPVKELDGEAAGGTSGQQGGPEGGPVEAATTGAAKWLPQPRPTAGRDLKLAGPEWLRSLPAAVAAVEPKRPCWRLPPPRPTAALSCRRQAVVTDKVKNGMAKVTPTAAPMEREMVEPAEVQQRWNDAAWRISELSSRTARRSARRFLQPQERLMAKWAMAAFVGRDRIPSEDFFNLSWEAARRDGFPMTRRQMIEATGVLEDMGYLVNDETGVHLQRMELVLALGEKQPQPALNTGECKTQ